ncbi:hypothetical protein LCGC14_0977260 [marine sediment metagenome]|uniref:Uncharacterized protein n=1 Tax=marine sediment metagenome TaxID=412755 RepID=A0A0F9N9W4_9ZZZZ
MSKKDEAFELFAQGKTNTAPEVGALELSKESGRRYYHLWKKARAHEALETLVGARLIKPSVSVSSLPVGAQFVLGRRRYRKLGVQAGKVSCLHLTNPERGWVGVTTVGIEPSTQVLSI